MKKFFFVLMVFSMLNFRSYAATWVRVGDYEYIDKDSIQYYINDHGEMQFDKKIYWIKLFNHDDMYEDIEKNIKKKISYCIDQWIMDMTKKSYVVKSSTSYDEKGNPVFSYSLKDYELNWNPIIPESKGEFWYELVKKPSYLKKLYKMQLLEESK